MAENLKALNTHFNAMKQQNNALKKYNQILKDELSDAERLISYFIRNYEARLKNFLTS